jgi:CRP/FNR family transcriptional regulator, cyclic AMP receptor protein
MWFLKHCNLFDRLSPEQIKRLEMRSRLKTFPAHNPIYLPVARADSVFLLAKGLAKVSHLNRDGKESILAFVESGELFGELAMFEEEQRNEYVEAIESSTVVMIPADEMNHLMNENADMAIGITRMIGLRRQRVERRLKNLLFLPNRERLVHLLLDLAEQFGWQSDEGIRLRIRLSHQDLANLVGSTRETITVALGQLKSEGSIEGGRRSIVLTNPTRLAESVHRQLPCQPQPTLRTFPSLVAS